MSPLAKFGLVLGAALACGTAQAAGPDAVRTRIAAYRELGAAFKAVNDGLRGEVQTVLIQQSARQIRNTSRQQYNLFPAGSGPQPGVKTAARAGHLGQARAVQGGAGQLRAAGGGFPVCGGERQRVADPRRGAQARCGLQGLPRRLPRPGRLGSAGHAERHSLAHRCGVRPDRARRASPAGRSSARRRSGETLPAGVKLSKTAVGSVYAARDGRTLYGLDLRTILRAGPDPAQYCTGACAEQWEPLLAPTGTKPNIVFPRGGPGSQNARPAGFVDPQKAPDWTVIEAAQGPQWVYKGWHLVFARRDDKRGSSAFDGADSFTWNTLKYVPPAPVLVAPPGVAAIFDGGVHVLAASDGRLLFTGPCGKSCAGWTPLAGGAASTGVGAWAVDRSGDSPQWTYRGARVFVASPTDPRTIPAGAKVLRP
jgi:predicted lipoprotein with Yx(FWY)xxD motif